MTITKCVGNGLKAERQWRLHLYWIVAALLNVGNGLKAERQWRQLIEPKLYLRGEVGNGLKAERQWRLFFTDERPFLPPLTVGNGLKAERQWRQVSCNGCRTQAPPCWKRTKSRKAMKTEFYLISQSSFHQRSWKRTKSRKAMKTLEQNYMP